MRTGLTISTTGHVAVLAWGLITFVAKPFDAMPAESMPVDIISADKFSEITKGVKEAKKAEQPKPLVEKIDEAKPVETPQAKISEKKEIAATAPESSPAESKPEKVTKKEPEPKADPIAEALKKDENQKKPAEKTEAKRQAPPLPPKKPTPPQPKFDPAKVAALLDKRDAQRHAATGAAVNSLASLGAVNSNAERLSQTELDALRAKLMQLWNPPAGIKNPEEMIVRIRVRFRPDGTLSAPPQVLTSGKGAMFESARDSAIRAIFRGQPFDMLRPETYETWKDVEITFDPRDMFRG